MEGTGKEDEEAAMAAILVLAIVGEEKGAMTKEVELPWAAHAHAKATNSNANPMKALWKIMWCHQPPCPHVGPTRAPPTPSIL